MESLPFLEIVRYGEIDLLALERSGELGTVLLHESSSIVDRVVIDTDKQACSFCILIVLLEFAVDSELAVIIDSGTKNYEVAAGIPDLLKIDIALIFGNIDTNKGISCLIFLLKILKSSLLGFGSRTARFGRR